mgnify:CR=1 FL=1
MTIKDERAAAAPKEEPKLTTPKAENKEPMSLATTALALTKMADRLVKANETQDAWGFNMVLAGHHGVGKTVLASSAQDSQWGKDVIIIDIDGGSRSISDRGDVTLFRPTSWSEIGQIYEYLANEKHSFKTIVIDSLTEAQKIGLDKIKAEGGHDSTSLPDYGKSNDQIIAMARAFRTISQTKGCHVIFTTLLTEEKDSSTGVVLLRPALTPKAALGVCGAVDAVVYLQAEEGGERVLVMRPNNRIVAKVRQPRSGPQIPHELRGDDITMDAILKIAVQQGKNKEEKESN